MMEKQSVLSAAQSKDTVGVLTPWECSIKTDSSGCQDKRIDFGEGGNPRGSTDCCRIRVMVEGDQNPLYKVVKCDKCHRPQITTAKGRVFVSSCGKSFKALKTRRVPALFYFA